jgi:hypothetical protein
MQHRLAQDVAICVAPALAHRAQAGSGCMLVPCAQQAAWGKQPMHVHHMPPQTRHRSLTPHARSCALAQQRHGLALACNTALCWSDLAQHGAAQTAVSPHCQGSRLVTHRQAQPCLQSPCNPTTAPRRQQKQRQPELTLLLFRGLRGSSGIHRCHQDRSTVRAQTHSWHQSDYHTVQSASAQAIQNTIRPL